jgi:hypothetical protein
MMLNWLAPEIQEAILRLPYTLGGRLALSETALRMIARLSTWAEQRCRCPSPTFVKSQRGFLYLQSFLATSIFRGGRPIPRVCAKTILHKNGF